MGGGGGGGLQSSASSSAKSSSDTNQSFGPVTFGNVEMPGMGTSTVGSVALSTPAGSVSLSPWFIGAALAALAIIFYVRHK